MEVPPQVESGRPLDLHLLVLRLVEEPKVRQFHACLVGVVDPGGDPVDQRLVAVRPVSDLSSIYF